MNGEKVATGCVVVLIGIVIIAILGAIFMPIYGLTYRAQKSECRAFARESGFETKFEVLVKFAGLPVTWDCFARTQSGKWIPKDRLREID